MKTTEQFEAWWKSAYADSYDKSTVGYVLVKSTAWTAWQASRAAVEVELPAVEKWRSVDAVRAQSAYRVLVDNAIRAAGIRVKG